MTILVRDAEDLIETNLRYHRAQGVDLFLIGDNGSTDRTLEILEPYREAGLVELDHIEGDARHVWSVGRTMLARKAYELGADWVVHDDHDEFWWPLKGTLKDVLGAIPEQYGLVSAPRTEFVAQYGEEFWPERLTVREARFRRPPKIIHRTHPRVRIRQPHPVDIWIDHGTSPRDGLVGRPGVPGAPAPEAGAPPGAPEDDRDQEDNQADDHQDHTDDLRIDGTAACVDGPGEDRPEGDQDQADDDSHDGVDTRRRELQPQLRRRLRSARRAPRVLRGSPWEEPRPIVLGA